MLLSAPPTQIVPPLQCTPLDWRCPFLAELIPPLITCPKRTTPPPRHTLTSFLPLYLTPLYLYLSLPLYPYLIKSSVSLIFLFCYFSLYLSSTFCTPSPLSILETCHSLLSISPLTLYPRFYYLSTPILSARFTHLRLVFSPFYFTPLPLALLITLRSVCSALPDPSPICSHIVAPLMLLYGCSSLYWSPGPDRKIQFLLK